MVWVKALRENPNPNPDGRLFLGWNPASSSEEGGASLSYFGIPRPRLVRGLQRLMNRIVLRAVCAQISCLTTRRFVGETVSRALLESASGHFRGACFARMRMVGVPAICKCNVILNSYCTYLAAVFSEEHGKDPNIAKEWKGEGCATTNF